MFCELRLSVIGKPPETALTLTGPPRRHLNITLIALQSLYADAKYELNNSFVQKPLFIAKCHAKVFCAYALQMLTKIK